MEVGRDEVTLRTGKQANKRNIQFAHQALLALFGKLGRRRGSVLRRAVFALFVRVRVGGVEILVWEMRVLHASPWGSL